MGHPFCKFSLKNEAYVAMVEKLANKVTGWKPKSLSMAGRMILIKLVIQALPRFIMQSFTIPKGILLKMDSLIHDFF